MGARLRIISSGISSLQDSGRFGWASSGVPLSGAFHPYLYQLACTLVDNDSSPAVEILAGQFVVSNEGSESTTFAVVGGVDSRLGNVASVAGVVLGVDPGETLEVTAQPGCPAYIVFPNLMVDPVLGSVAWDSLSKLGPPPLAQGDALTFLPDRFIEKRGRFLLRSPEKNLTAVRELKVIPGPHWQEAMEEKTWQVEGVSRSGIRLASEEPLPGGVNNLPSFPVLPGCVQLPPSGQPIILGPDSGVTGGYPVVASVISSDLGILAELDGSKPVRFVRTSLEEAKEAWFARSTALKSTVADPAHF